ncbi:MAG: uroporphyrinogen decarboxylase [Ignavibacteria bacterium]|nr:uroporphyrinogen decarboxylase [Ignavibacteria bacterium]MCU7503701.1 uroporphyrinogen decarboxylase [Ignavibacteria bacterium]MCU7517652.1 uroporphyrinogen decarboxylase [Ignavibacteria bacterium]
MNIENDLFLRACRRQKVERTPVWVMRQAGRYLPEYRAIREKADFLTMCKTPELASEVTIQPVEIIGVDAAIIFSDILVIPEAMGMELEMNEGKGPVFPKPIRSAEEAKGLKAIDPYRDLKYVMDAIKMTKDALRGRVPLIGFSGSPWTLLTYMVEGRGSKNFSQIKKMIYDNPRLAHELLDKISRAVADYLSAKIEAGVNAVQIFDTWGGILSPSEFSEFSLQYITKVISELKKKDEPVIVFAKGVHFCLQELTASGADVLGLDWTMDLKSVRDLTGGKVALQGNMDPCVLYAREDVIRKKALEVMESYGNGTGHIFNLGHGILPDTDPENLKALVKFVKEESPRFHK